jgi:hypothetical protein
LGLIWVRDYGRRRRAFGWLWIASCFTLWHPASQAAAANPARKELDTCETRRVRTLPGSRQFASDFLEAMASDPTRDGGAVWGLTADLSSQVPPDQRAMYIAKSADGGKTWNPVARVDARFFDAGIGEGERNGLGVSPGGRDFVITTQKGAFQVIPQPDGAAPVVNTIAGPRVPRPDPEIVISKHEGDPVKAGVVKISADGKRMIVGYGYFDLNPQLFSYRRAPNGSWIEPRPLPLLPTDMDILSMEFGDRRTAAATSLYVGTGDQAFRLKARARQWTRIDGVGDDSAIQGISTVGGPHLAACWGVYNPISADAVERVTHASFLLHRNEDEAGPSIRAFGVEVDPARPAHQVVTSLTGVYASSDFGKTWKRLNDLPDGEFRTAHFNREDGTVIVSGIFGTFVANPFSKSCFARLKRRTP